MTKLPFDLEAAKKGAKLVTRDGREAVFVAYDEGAADGYRLLVRIVGNECAGAYTNIGGSMLAFDLDLFILAETRSINGHEYPAPMTEAPEVGDLVWVVDVLQERLYYSAKWLDTESNNGWIKRGLLHPTKEAAIAHARALILAGGGEV